MVVACPACGREVEGPGLPQSVEEPCCFWCGLPGAGQRLTPVPRREPVRTLDPAREAREARRERARQLVEGEGMSLRQAAREMGLAHASTVLRMLRR